MVNEVIDAIAIKLNSTFGDGYEIYKDDVTQGLHEPCFFIAVLQPSRERIVGDRHKQVVPIDLSYFPVEGNEEMFSVAEKLFDSLEQITLPRVGGTLHGTNRSIEIVDGVLHFSVTYTAWLSKTTAETAIETMSLTTGTTKEE